MRVMFGNWKYVFRNLWYLLPSAVLPAVFLALSLDYPAVASFTRSFFSGTPRTDFITFLRVFSFIRIDGWLGAAASILMIVCLMIFSALTLALVEKHMRIGKRTAGGLFLQFKNLLLPTGFMTVFFVVVYEIWTVILSALLFALCSITQVHMIYVFFPLVTLLMLFLLLYVIACFFLWLPCMQITGFGAYDALTYSYRLAANVRFRLTFAMAISYLIATAVIAGFSFLPPVVFLPVAFVVYFFLYTGVLVRMEAVYFTVDKIDREDLLRSYREL